MLISVLNFFLKAISTVKGEELDKFNIKGKLNHLFKKYDEKNTGKLSKQAFIKAFTENEEFKIFLEI
jgi:hypothetical protein